MSAHDRPSTTAPVLVAKGLNLWYGANHAVRDVSLEASGGEILALLGSNGAGKTSTIHLLTGILSARSGSVEVEGYDIARSPIEARRRIGYIPDRPDVYETLTAREFVRFVCGLYGFSQEHADENSAPLLRRFGLEDKADQLLGSYSFGMRQKAVIIATLAHDPALLVLDEPIVGLDPTSARALMEVLRERASQGVAVLFSTHLLGIVDDIADRVAVIDQGEVRVRGTLDEMRAAAGMAPSARLDDAFFQLTAGRGAA